MSLLGFQRRRRMNAEREESNNPEIPEGSHAEEKKEVATITDKEVDDMDMDQVRSHLDHLDVKYAHNTGEAKLKERLKDAIK